MQIDVPRLLEVASATIAIILSLYALYKARRADKADLAAKFQDIAGDAADDILELRREVKEYQKEIAELSKRCSDNQEEIRKLKEDYEAKIIDLENQLKTERDRNDILEKEVDELRTLMRKKGIEPPPRIRSKR